MLADSLELTLHRVPLRVVGLDGGERRGEVFVDQGRSQSGAMGSLGERLNRPESNFFQFGSDGQVWLLRLGAIAYVEALEPLPEAAYLAEIGARREAVTLELASGESLHGDLVYLLPPSADSVADLLDSADYRFLLLADGPVCRYVQRDAIVRALPSPDGPAAFSG